MEEPDAQVILNLHDTIEGLKIRLQVYPDEMNMDEVEEVLQDTLNAIRRGEADVLY